MKSTEKLIFIIALQICLIHTSQAMVRMDQVEQISKLLGTNLKKLFNDVTRYRGLKMEFEILHDKKQMVVKKLNISYISKEFNDNLRELLLSKMASVKNIKHKAETTYNDYTEDSNIKRFDYYNDKTVPPEAVRLEPTFFHDIEINVNRSHVQLPANIYQFHKDILNEAKWSQELDQCFLENFERSPELLWQYFGSETGMFRTFPGYRQDINVLDYYDCRRRLWYSQAINSPKDVIILLDHSGSMTGSHFTIAKLTVKSLIDTLQQDDFFNVMTFRKETNFIIPCTKGNLTQASSKHKDAFRTAVDGLVAPKGMSDIKFALRDVFKILNNKNAYNMRSSNCTKVLLLISDGIEEDDSIQDEIDRLNVNNDVVIFSYLIGEGKHTSVMKNIACRNGGDFYKFLTVGNVWNGVLKYQHRLSHPIVRSNNEMVIFTPLYLDSSGLGMMTTVSVGVFSNKSTGENIDTLHLLGVAGVDIRITLLQQQYPKAKLGVFGHAFSINNNGLFLIHPRFRDQSGFLPDPASVYLDELEYTTDRSKSEELKIAMIDGKTGCMEAELDWLYFGTENRRVVRYNATYCYSPTEGTPFSSGVSVPNANAKYMESSPPNSDLELEQSIEALGSGIDGIVEIANWIFCDIPSKAQETEPVSLKLYPTAFELKSYLQSYYSRNVVTSLKEVPTKCNNETLLPLLQSAKTISNFKKSLLDRKLLEMQKVSNVYIISSTGYIFSYPSSHNESINRDILTEKRYSHPAAFYIQGMTDMIVFTTSIRYGKPTTTSMDREQTTSVGTALTISPDHILTAVIGMDVSTSYLKKMLVEASKSFGSGCAEPPCTSHNCEYVDNLQCYLVDENGYIIVSNRASISEQGLFFGYVNGLLMEKLEQLNIYERREYIDNQAKCNEEVSTISSSAVRLKTMIHHIGSMITITTNQILAFISLFSTMFKHSSRAQNEHKNVSCIKTIIIHTLKNHSLSYSGKIVCNKDCEQTYAIHAVKGTNLLLIMVTKNNCECTTYHFDNEPVKQANVGICNENIRYRKAFPLCYKAMADQSECSDANMNIISLRYIMMLVLFRFVLSVYVL